MILDRIHLYYAQLCDENEPIIPSTKPFLPLNISNDWPKNDFISMSPGNSVPKQRSNFFHQNKYCEMYKQNNFIVIVRSKSMSSLIEDSNQDFKSRSGEIHSVDLTGDDEPSILILFYLFY